MKLHAEDGPWTFIPRQAITKGRISASFLKQVYQQPWEVLFVINSPSKSYKQRYTIVRQLPEYSNIKIALTTDERRDNVGPTAIAHLGPHLYVRMLPDKEASVNKYLGFQTNSEDVKYSNCQSMPFNYWALYPNDRNKKVPSGWTNTCYYEPCKSWLAKSKPLYGPHKLPNDLLFQVEMRFGGYANPAYYNWGCGTSLIGDGSKSSMTVAIGVR